jgi:RNase P subunit RPR2
VWASAVHPGACSRRHERTVMPEYTADSVLSTPQLARGISVARISTTTAPHQVSPSANPLACHHCSAIDRAQVGAGSSPHISARCQHCGQSIRWLKQYTPLEHQPRRQQDSRYPCCRAPTTPERGTVATIRSPLDWRAYTRFTCDECSLPDFLATHAHCRS